VPLYVVSEPDVPITASSFHVAAGLDWEHDPAARAAAVATSGAGGAGAL
jgi:hypothetical protein